jgi:hypothetical protein
MDNELPWHVNPNPVVPLRKKPKKRQNRPARRRIMNKAKADRAAFLEAQRPFTVHLKRGHDINGTVYGPGTLTLPGQIARELSNREYHADQQDAIFRGERAAIIGGRTAQGSHRVRFVPVETFADSYGSAMPVEIVSGKGQVDPGQGPKF